MSEAASSSLFAISPIDGRYINKLNQSTLPQTLSEFGLIHMRLKVEIEWLKYLSNSPQIPELSLFSDAFSLALDQLIQNFSLEDAENIKSIEKITNHDVKAVEYFLQDKINNWKKDKHLNIPHNINSFIHFGCTSEDINNLAYALSIQTVLNTDFLTQIKNLNNTLNQLSKQYSEIPMLARTHGQPATPTVIGKIFKNTEYRLSRQIDYLEQFKILGKFNGAVGNFNAHLIAYPDINWPKFSQNFIESLNLTYNPYTDQIEPHDWIAELSNTLALIHTILIDFSRDIWGYISLGYFNQKLKSQEVGSSTMPHKVNPIDFENAEGNLGLSNALFKHFSEKLPISRFQRDLSDSTVLRNLGSAFGYSFIALQSLSKGLNKLSPNIEKIKSDLNQHPEVLGEAIQTIMRKYNIENPYEKLKSFSRGKVLNQQDIEHFIDSLDQLPNAIKSDLKQLTPFNYLGVAQILCQ